MAGGADAGELAEAFATGVVPMGPMSAKEADPGTDVVEIAAGAALAGTSLPASARILAAVAGFDIKRDAAL